MAVRVVADWLVEVRTESTLQRQAVLTGWASLQVIERYNTVGSWQLAGPIDAVRPLLGAGLGVVISRGGVQVMAGPATKLVRSGDGTATISGADDLVYLADRIVYPNPAQAITGQTIDYWTATSTARETIIINLIKANAGSAALVARQVGNLRVPATSGRGGTATVTARLDNLLTLVGQLAEAGGLRVATVHTESGGNRYRDVVVTATADKSGYVRFGPAAEGGPGRLAADWSYTVGAPTVTRAIPAGGGEGAARIFRERADAGAETLWGRRVESVVDQRQTTATAELDAAGDDALTNGAGPTELSATVLDVPDLGYRIDWSCGDKVAVTVDGVTITDLVREAATTVAAQSGQQTETVVPTVGSAADASALTPPSQRALTSALRRLAALERRV